MVGLFDAEVRGQLFELGRKRRLSSAKAERELGWRPHPVTDTIVDTATSLRGVGAPPIGGTYENGACCPTSLLNQEGVIAVGKEKNGGNSPVSSCGKQPTQVPTHECAFGT